MSCDIPAARLAVNFELVLQRVKGSILGRVTSKIHSRLVTLYLIAEVVHKIEKQLRCVVSIYSCINDYC